MGLFVSEANQFSQSTWSVSELTAYIREMFAIDYRLQDVTVGGEISNFTRARSGHLYFTLKDAGAQIKCVMWRSAAERLFFEPGEGDAVLANGRISVYEAGGVYQLYAERLQPAGRGNLAVAFEQLKQRLADEGLFDPEHKKPIPLTPHKIGIVTSADAAALRDILNVLNRRYPLVEVLIAPTLVQGAEAPPQIVRALQWLDGRTDIDTIIVARGGGSIEDLWAFNDERVARAIFAAQHPVITGVGHETDFTIADFVADRRAPTPSAAAELATPDIEEIRPLLAGYQAMLQSEMQDLIRQKQWQVQTLVRALSHLSPQGRLDNNRQRLDVTLARLDRAMNHRLAQEQGRLAVAVAGLTAVSPLATLSRGYAIVRLRENGRVVRSISHVASGDSLTVQVSDGQFDVRVGD
ncbi:MAG: exodeoxyribonuclease VII large subunit [Ardenticatenaceae bacterium]|nr:exodeoxyribonuclease VII large subunit [Anaerolineales bacterium]MCB8982461.1 exodeoxyribonuclease VII large subunit [Ardenticatenaceae bacterium]MCB8986214.1 exodeoxyribonuclease VII large subunit [Ardenticatenaceae bacterium]